MEEKFNEPIAPEHQHLQNILKKMYDQYIKTVQKIKENHSDELIDFHARRLVEMAGYIIMGQLLLMDAQREPLL